MEYFLSFIKIHISEQSVYFIEMSGFIYGKD